jgi:DNA repair exonuclease SbcCD ATPase subunit
MTHITQITSANFGPYLGGQTVKLEPGVYAVIARRESDDESSNWVGKSWFLSMVPYVLFGWHLAKSEDDVISWGEDLTSVQLFFSDGSHATRSRARGKSTQLVFDDSTTGATCGGPKAQEEVARRIGLSELDFFSTCFARQKEISKLATEGSTDRMNRYTAWFDLQQGEEAIERAAAEQEKAQDAVNDHLTLIDLAKRQLATLEHYGALETLVETITAKVEAAREEHKAATRELELDRKKAAFDERMSQGKTSRAALDALPRTVIPEERLLRRKELEGEWAVANAERETVQARMDHGFDGVCPVTAGNCPSKEWVDSCAAGDKKQRDALDMELEAIQTELSALAAEATAAANQERAYERAAAKLDALREQAKLLQLEVKGRPTADVSRSSTRAANAHDALVKLKTDLAMADGLVQRLALLEAELETKLRTARAAGLALEVCKKAQRSVAKTGAQRVADGANAMLEEAGIDLRLEALFEAEGKKPASSCAACGRGFPKSHKVKTCECGAARGLAIKEKPFFSLSRVSGAAEDLAGGALQLSAAAYLRARRAAPWSVAMIDEPFGALDKANRRLFAAHLVTMLSGRYGFEQAFITAHQDDVLDAIPHRIEIIADEHGSRLVG